MTFSNWMLLNAVLLSLISGWFSVDGMMAIFPGNEWAIATAGMIMEISKLTMISWIKLNLNGKKSHLFVAIVIATGLAILTSCGVYGFFAKQHASADSTMGETGATIDELKSNIAIKTSQVARKVEQLATLDAQVTAFTNASKSGSKDALYASNRATNVRNAQQGERIQLNTDIAMLEADIARLNATLSTVAKHDRNLAADLGPVKYAASLIYGANPNHAQITTVTTGWILMIVMLFDPTAIVMLFFATKAKIEQPVETSIPVAETPNVEPTIEPQIEQPVSQPEPQDVVEEPVKERRPLTLKFHVADPESEIITVGQTVEIYRDESMYFHINGKRVHRDVVRSSVPQMFLSDLERTLPVETFGVTFPKKAAKDEYFVRVDVTPHRPYKFDGVEWKQMGKNASRHVTPEYLSFLEQQIQDGLYDEANLTSAEKSVIATMKQK